MPPDHINQHNRSGPRSRPEIFARLHILLFARRPLFCYSANEPQTGRRVLAGQIQLPVGERLRAVIMMTDLRGFTALSDRLPGEEVIELLDDYFDTIVTSVEARKGETLKFMGNGVLSIFTAADDGDFSEAGMQVLEAALEGLERLGMVNKARRETNRTEVRIGIGLHVGEVIFGNG